MRVTREAAAGGERFCLYKEKEAIGGCTLHFEEGTAVLEELTVREEWRGRGYGSYLLKKVLAATGGYGQKGESLHRLPAPKGEGEAAFYKKFGFAPDPARPGFWLRRRRADLTAVDFIHQNLSRWLTPGGFFIDATCGNGGDTEFLCRLAGESGRVLALDIQQQAVDNTNRRLQAAGLGAVGRAVQADHAQLAGLAEPESADCVLFNFGYLPGADHSTFTTPASSLPALTAALSLLRPGGVLAVCLYSGGPNGHGEKDAVRAFLHGLPLARYTVLECCFANWADTAPLPCFVFKR